MGIWGWDSFLGSLSEFPNFYSCELGPGLTLEQEFKNEETQAVDPCPLALCLGSSACLYSFRGWGSRPGGRACCTNMREDSCFMPNAHIRGLLVTGVFETAALTKGDRQSPGIYQPA